MPTDNQFKYMNNSKKLLLLVSIVFLLTGCLKTNNKVYTHDLQSTIIEYELTGNPEGKSTLYIKGDRSARITEGEYLSEGINTAFNSLSIEKEGEIYEVDLKSKTGYKALNPVYNELKTMNDEEKDNHLLKEALGLKDGEIPQIIGEEEVAGQKCIKYKYYETGEICIWKGIPLMTVIKIPSTSNQSMIKATNINNSASIDDSIFEVPKEITI